MARYIPAILSILLACGGVGCDASTTPAAEWDVVADGTAEDAEQAPCPEALPYATEVVSFTPGSNAGFGQGDMPGIVLGPPAPGPPSAGSVDVVSLGVGGEIVLGFGDRTLVDGPGPDLVVWENTFWVGGDPSNPFTEPGEVAVSEDGETWTAFPCTPEADGQFDPGCAGWRPRLEYEACEMPLLDPELVGGDLFDLADIGVDAARFVRIRDLATEGSAPSAGFDLDAVGAVHFAP